MRARDRGRERGSLMLVVSCFLVLMTSVIAAWLSATITDSRQIDRKEHYTQALYLAEAGAEHAKEWLTAQANLRSAIIRNAGTIPASTVLGASSVSLGGGSYTSSIQVALGSWSVPIYTISSVGTVDPDRRAGSGDELRRKIIVKASMGSFARYAYFTNSEGNNIWFITMDVLLGLVHSNSSFRIAGKPDFWGKLTSTADSFIFYNHGSPVTTSSPSNPPTDVPNFRDGYQLASPTVYFPTDTTDMEQAAGGARGLVINSNSEITLGVGAGNAGTITYTQRERVGGRWRTVTRTTEVYDEAVSPGGKAIIYVNGDAEVSGTLAGQLSILAEGDLVITGDINYRVNPVDYDGDGRLSDADGDGVNDPAADRTGDGDTNDPGEAADDTDDNGDGIPDPIGYNQPDSTDTLGLVANGDVVVADDGGGAIDRTICATVMALGATGGTGSFRVENYDSHLEKTLTVVGGIVQKQRGAVGTFSGDYYGTPSKVSGFSKNYIYDRRLLYYPPPYFPPTNLLDMIYWQEVPP